MGFLLRNWQLKIGALALATILYTGLVFSGSFSENTIQVPVSGTNQAGDAFVLSGDLGTVEVRYRAASDTPANITADSFVATVDLGAYDMDQAPDAQVLPVDVTSLIDGVDVLVLNPTTVTVEMDRLDVKEVPVRVVSGDVPDGLDTGRPQITPDTVQVRGAASLVRLVDHAVARVRIDPSGIAIDAPVILEPVDVEGQPVAPVDLDPASVTVQIDVQQIETNRTVPVRPDISGTPSAGFALEGLQVEPSTVTLRGLPEVLSEIDEVLTEPLSLEDASSDQTFEAQLSLPEGTRIVEPGPDAVATVTATIGPSVSSRTFVTGVTCTGAGDNACLPAFDQVSVTLSGAAASLSALSAVDVTVTVDVGGQGPGTYDLVPALPPLPDGVELVVISPGSVPVTVVAPATPAPTSTPAPAP
ncbi:MAG: CdaR family protein [Candidatus Limnocylindria bacterium]